MMWVITMVTWAMYDTELELLEKNAWNCALDMKCWEAMLSNVQNRCTSFEKRWACR